MKHLRMTASAAVLCLGLALMACSPGARTIASDVGDAISGAVDTVLGAVVTAGNEVCETRENQDVELVRAIGFGAFNNRLVASGARFHIQGLRCLPEAE